MVKKNTKYILFVYAYFIKARGRHSTTMAAKTDNVPREDATVAMERNSDDLPKPQTPGLLVRLSLDVPTVITMLKYVCYKQENRDPWTNVVIRGGSLPPTIAIAIYQSPAVHQYFTNLGYLIPLVTLLAMAILPRGKYIKNLILNSLAICLSGAVGLLVLWSSIQARKNTTQDDDNSPHRPDT